MASIHETGSYLSYEEHNDEKNLKVYVIKFSPIMYHGDTVNAIRASYTWSRARQDWYPSLVMLGYIDPKITKFHLLENHPTTPFSFLITLHKPSR
jgi:hypothetical protein